MILALSFALATQAVASPVLQPGSNAILYEVTNAVANALQKQDWAKAVEAGKALPTRKVTIVWDDSAVPAASKKDFLIARDAFANDFVKQSVDFTVAFAPKGDLKISFTDQLPLNDKGVRPGAAYITSPNPSDPRVEAVIGLKRGLPSVATEADDVYNELAYAVMMTLGKADSPHNNEFSNRSEQSARGRHRMSPLERVFLQRTASSLDSVRLAIQSKKPMLPANPQAQIDVQKIELEPVVQGAVQPFSIQMSNVGTSTMIINARPDCGCVSITPVAAIEPGETILLKGAVDSTEFVGPLDKRIYISTNDPTKPAVTVPVTMFAKPLFRLIQPAGYTILSEGGAARAEIFLVIDDSIKLKAKGVETAGLTSTATITPWSGTLADPEMLEPAKPRKGYRILVDVAKGMPQGRYGITVQVDTDNLKFPVLRHSFHVQTGIVALPDSVYFGEIGREPRRAVTFVTRPGKKFKITKIETDSDYIDATAVDIKNGEEYRIVIQLNGKQPQGSLSEKIRLTTDDPLQKTIEISVAAAVK